MRIQDAWCQPLRTSSGELLGAVVAQSSHDELSRQSADGLAILTSHLVILLERRQMRHASAAMARALAVGRASTCYHTAIRPSAEATGPAERKVLRSLARALRELPTIVAAVALMPAPMGRLVVIAPRRAARELDVEASRRVARVCAAVGGSVEKLSPGEPARQDVLNVLRAVAPVDQREPGTVCMLAVGSGGACYAHIALVHGAWSQHPWWLPFAEALCLATGERIAAGRVRAAGESQARDYDGFLSLMAHELRSPLTSVKGYSQLLMRQARRHALPDAAVRSAEVIEQQAARLSEMIDELHDAARLRRSRLDLLTTRTELVPIVREQVARWVRISSEHEYHVIIAEDEELIGDWDAHRVAQIIRDLLDNATRFSPGGGRVDIALGRAGDFARLIVRDRGIGVAAAERGRIFEHLYRAREAQRRHLAGLGIGLFVSRAIAERHGGHLRLCASSTGGSSGSEFALELPLSVAPRPS